MWRTRPATWCELAAEAVRQASPFLPSGLSCRAWTRRSAQAARCFPPQVYGPHRMYHASWSQALREYIYSVLLASQQPRGYMASHLLKTLREVLMDAVHVSFDFSRCLFRSASP